MGGLASLYWDDIGTSDESFGGAPWFESDSKLWADWIASMHADDHRDARAKLSELGLAPLLCATSDGEDAEWTTPEQLEAAAHKALAMLQPLTSAIEEFLENDDAIEALTSSELHRALLDRAWKALDSKNDDRFAAFIGVWFELFEAGEDPSEVLAALSSDLESVARNASWAKGRGIQRVTMHVSW